MCLGFEIQTLCFCVVNVLIKGEIEKASGQYISLIELPQFEFESGNFGGSTLLSILVGESRLFVSWCVADRCGVAGSDEDRGRSRRPGADY
jgi:hypothetical protein